MGPRLGEGLREARLHADKLAHVGLLRGALAGGGRELGVLSFEIFSQGVRDPHELGAEGKGAAQGGGALHVHLQRGDAVLQQGGPGDLGRDVGVAVAVPAHPRACR